MKKSLIAILLTTLTFISSQTAWSLGDESDQDGDGYLVGGDDCDDNNININPDATELCDGVDNNCDGTIDESTASDAAVWYADADSDAYGNAALSQSACTQPTGYVSNDDDCDDLSASINPAASEVCDGLDNDCDGSSDPAVTWYLDSDSDGYGVSTTSLSQCEQPTGYVSNYTDCDDTSADRYPGNSEICDGIDNDCDESVADEEEDADADGTINCNDSEECDEIDNDGDGLIDEDVTEDFYADVDGDGYGNPDDVLSACELPAGFVENDDDCNDSESAAYTGADEVCGDSTDNNCDGSVDEGCPEVNCEDGVDGDSDGDVDCDDADCSEDEACAPNTFSDLESFNTSITFSELSMGETVTLTAPDPTELALFKSALDSCNCSWSLDDETLASFVDASACETGFSPSGAGSGTIIVTVDCGAEGEGTYRQSFSILAAAGEEESSSAASGCSLNRDTSDVSLIFSWCLLLAIIFAFTRYKKITSN